MTQVVGDPAVLDAPEIHVADPHPLAGGRDPMKSPEWVASCRPKAAAHSPMKSRASSMQTLSENAAWNGRCQLS